MKSMQIARDIVPLAHLKNQTSQVFRQLHADKRPVVVTQHGRPAAVLLTPEEYDRLQEKSRFLSSVSEGLAESVVGRLVDDEELSAALESEFSVDSDNSAE